jgi:hypothetical protein
VVNGTHWTDPSRAGDTHPKPGSLLKNLADLQQRSGFRMHYQ